jgi:hypothetical protein
MATNEISSKTELNLRETHLLRRLDEKVQLGEPKAVETQYGDVVVAKNVVGGFVASVNNENYFDLVFAYSASDAFLKLADKLRAEAAK